MKKLSLVIIIALALTGCAKWFDTDISGFTVRLLSPPNSHTDSLLSKTFLWEAMDGADDYQIQIVSPTFDSIVTIYLDSITEGTSYNLSLIPGVYAWRVKARNEGFESKWGSGVFTIEDTDNLGGQSISNALPSDGYISNEIAVDFSWDALTKATSYDFTIKSGVNTISSSAETTAAKTHTFATEGTFTWHVQAKNSISASLEYSSTITIDTTQPTVPTLLTFVDDTIKSFPATLTWSVETDNGTSIMDSLFVSKNANLSNPTLDTLLSDQTSLVLDTLSPGNYFWRLGRIDAAGNYGGSTLVKGFVVE